MTDLTWLERKMEDGMMDFAIYRLQHKWSMVVRLQNADCLLGIQRFTGDTLDAALEAARKRLGE